MFDIVRSGKWSWFPFSWGWVGRDYGKREIAVEWRALGTYVNQVVSVTITWNKSYWQHAPPEMVQWEKRFTSTVFFPQIRSPSLVIGKHQTNTTWRTVYKLPDENHSERWRAWKTWNDRESPSEEETEETWELSQRAVLDWVLGQKRNINGKKHQN